MTGSLARFKTEYQEYHSITEARRRDQFRALASLCAFSNVEEPTDCTPENYKAWLRSLHEGNLSAVTVQKYGMLVRPFFGWAFDAGLYDANDLMAMKRVPFPEAKKSVPRPYSSKEVKKLWPAIARAHPLDDGTWLKRWRSKPARFRYRRIEHHAQNLQLTAVCRIALDCGLRRQEIYDLDLDDMHYDNLYIVVREGKGDKFREVPFTKVAKAAVKEWIEFRTELGPKHNRPWLSLTRIGPEGVWLRPMRFERFAMYVHDAGPSWELHRLRHTCATNWLRAGMALEKVSRLLGHAHITQTMGYVKLVPDDVQREVERHEDAFAKQVA